MGCFAFLGFEADRHVEYGVGKDIGCARGIGACERARSGSRWDVVVEGGDLGWEFWGRKGEGEGREGNIDAEDGLFTDISPCGRVLYTEL